MGQNILTPTQHFVLDMAAEEDSITDWFYFTGGTALSEFYLHHRYSEDLDFFSQDKIHDEIVDDFVGLVAKKLDATISKKTIMGHAICTLNFKKGEVLKIDFVNQPYQQLESGKKYKKLRIASLWDIVVDKVYTIFHRLNARDFVDLYFGMNEVGCDIDQLIRAVEEKYQAGFDKISLLSRLPTVKDVHDYPKMLVPFGPKKMEQFFLDQTKKLEKMIFK